MVSSDTYIMVLQLQSLIADLLLIGIVKNQQHVRAVAVQLQVQQDYAGVAHRREDTTINETVEQQSVGSMRHR